MTLIHGFELLHEQAISELNMQAQLFRHAKTGAQLLSLQNDDENKSFGITFKTPPGDSTGVAHILEHSVLCGSRKYPLKEPFIELAKGSFKTFLNAMTGDTATYYPVASTNLQDFYNLIDVYLDCVLYPNLTAHTFAQEGWHYELESADELLIFKGVVFNEMKGYYSTPDVRLYNYAQQTLFPDNTYGFDSGGDPKVIPDLTYEYFKDFHQRFYHPSNARIAFYGDDLPEERLRVMNEWLQDFEPREIDTHIEPQARFKAPKQFAFPYAVEPDSPNADKGMVMIGWMLDQTVDPELLLALSILGYVLIQTPASPLRKALLDAELGEEVVGGESGGLQHAFYAGLKGIAVDAAPKVEQLIFETLREQTAKSIDPQTIEAAVNTIEFHLRENNTGSFPRGLAIMFQALEVWIYDGNPFDVLAFETPLAAIKARLAVGERVFENLIQTYLLDNPHHTTVVLQPDPDLAKREAAAEEARLQAVRAAMSEAELQAVIDDTHELQRLQELPDSSAALATIPRLRLDDLDKLNRTIPFALIDPPATPSILYHDLFTNGIIYADLGLNLHQLPQELLPYVSLFGRALTQIGTEQEDYVRLTQRIGSKTGGLWQQGVTTSRRNETDSASWLFLRGKALPTQAADLLAIMRDVLLEVRLDNQGRFRQMALEEKARLESRLGFSGAGFVQARLNARFSEAGWAGEQMGGISYLFFLRELCQQIDNDWPAVLAKLEQIRSILVNREAVLCNVTTDDANWQRLSPQLDELLAALPTAPVKLAPWQPQQLAANEGLTVPTQVNSVGKAANLYDLGYKLHGSALVIYKYLRTSWLWEQVRMKGGAYGAHCGFDHITGVFGYLSAQDPNLLDTLEAFNQTPNFLREVELDEAEVTRSIIGAISDMDSYQLPDAKGWTSMARYIIGETDENRQKLRDEILSTSLKDFRAFADELEKVNEAGRVVVLTSPETLETVSKERPNWLSVTKVL